MIREVKFESQDRRINQILAVLNENAKPCPANRKWSEIRMILSN